MIRRTRAKDTATKADPRIRGFGPKANQLREGAAHRRRTEPTKGRRRLRGRFRSRPRFFHPASNWGLTLRFDLVRRRVLHTEIKWLNPYQQGGDYQSE